MFFEPLLLVLSILVLTLFSLGKQEWNRRRRIRRAAVMQTILRQLQGQKAWEAEKRWGPPSEVAEGSSGRRLYIWKYDRLPGVPDAPGLLVITLTMNESNEIEATHWEQRGGDVRGD